jgi:glycosyltransferase involved in cell wall biosynthesis
MDGGGMRHYAENLTHAMGMYAQANLGLFVRETEEEPYAAGGVATVRMARNRYRHLLREQYNPCYYATAAEHFMRTTMPSLVHITSDGIGLLAFSRHFLARGAKVVYTVHDPVPHEENITRWAKVVHRYKRVYQLPRLFDRLHAVHVHSEKHRHALGELYGRRVYDKTYVVQHGGGAAPAIRSGGKVSPELTGRDLNKDYTVLFFGRIHPYKGLDHLVAACGIAREKGCRLSLVVAGEGDAQGACSGDDAHTVFINRFIEDGEVAALFKMASVVVLPYTSATQSGVAPLAFAFGKPVICTRVGALDELVIDSVTGLLVPPGDPHALAEAIMSLSNDELREKMGRAAGSFLTEVLSWERVAAKHLQQYARILED